MAVSGVCVCGGEIHGLHACEINTKASSLLLAGLLTEIQCKSKRLRKNTKASPGQSTGDETEAADSADSKHVSSTTKLSKVAAAFAAEV